jgi:hypothetical protein
MQRWPWLVWLIVVPVYAVLLYLGITWAIPTFGVGGVIWTGLLVLISLYNGYVYLVRGASWLPLPPPRNQHRPSDKEQQ